MKIRFAVSIDGDDKRYEISGSSLLNDEEVFETIENQAIFPITEEITQFFELDTETLKVVKSIFYKMEDS